MEQAYEQVQIPIEFFKKERNGYASWQSALFRELKQNSEDAGATEIRVDLVEENFRDQPYVKVVLADNGQGMSLRVLRDVYFALGRTTKGEGTTGGFGRARILTNFSMDFYEICTGNIRAHGSGAQFAIEEVEQSVQGVTQTLMVDESTVGQLLVGLRGYLRECSQPDLDVYVNGEKYEFTHEVGKHIRDLYQNGAKFATVYYNPDAALFNRVLVRVTGSCMFSRWIYGVPGTVTIELEQWNSRNIMTSNRDGVREEYRQVMDAFVEELATETRTALKPKFTRRFEVFHGNVSFFKYKRQRRYGETRVRKGECDRRELMDSSMVVRVAEPLVSVSSLSSVSRARVVSSGHYDDGRDRSVQYSAEDDREIVDTHEVESRGRILTVADFVPSVPMFFDTSDEDVLRESVFWNPKVWNFTLNGDVADFGIWRSKLNLLFAWRAALEYTAEVALELELADEIEFLAGFCFCDELALHWQMEDGRHAMLLNPLDNLAKPKFKLGERMHMRKLMAFARHEMAHAIGFKAHNEDFAAALSSLDAASDDASAFTLIRKAIS